MTRAEKREGPVILVGFAAAHLPALSQIQPQGSVIWIEEPDVVRKRRLREALAEVAAVRDLVEWEYGLPGRADEFHAAHGGLEPSAVIPVTEYATPFAARLAERYGLPGAGYGAARILRDKALLRRVTRAAGIANPESIEVGGPAEAAAFLRSGLGPVVLKPANRQASIGVQIVRDAAQVEWAWADCVGRDEGDIVPDRLIRPRMLAERYVSGPEFSVELLVRAGEPLFANVTAKELFPGDRPVEAAHVVPADIAPQLGELLVERTRRVLAAVGFRDGMVHCEWIVSGGVPHLVECAGRMAGDGIMRLIQRAYPVDLVRAYYAVMKGVPPAFDLPRRAGRAAAVRFLTIDPGAVERIQGVEEARRADGVFLCEVSVKAGDRSDGLRSSWGRVGDVMVTADTPAQAYDRAAAAAAMIRIDVHPAAEVHTMAGAAS